MSDNTGGPAFASQLASNRDGFAVTGGMTLRDYFASNLPDEPTGDDYHATIKEALVGRKQPIANHDGWIAVIQFEADFRAAWRYMRADAMLKARQS